MSVDPQMTDAQSADHGELAAEIEALRQRVESNQQSWDAYRETVIKPRFADLNDAVDEAAAERSEICDLVEDLQAQVNQLEGRVEALMGVEEEAASSPDKRAQDLKQALIRRADARTDDGAGRASMYYKEVQDLFADLGHGDVKKPECYKAMNDVAETDGFFETSKVSREGSEVKAVAVKTAELSPDTGSSNPTTREGLSAGATAADGGEVNKYD